MTIRVEDLLERQKLRRKLTFWRVAALVIVALAIVASIYVAGAGMSLAGDHIARIRIEGTITEDEKLLERLEDIRKSSSVKGVIVTIDSPGGTTAGPSPLLRKRQAKLSVPNYLFHNPFLRNNPDGQALISGLRL